MKRALSKCVLAGVALMSASAFDGGAAAGRAGFADWATLHSERYGFMIAYPGNVFTPQEVRGGGDGHVLVSRDGTARLLVATFDNDTDATLEEYRDLLLEQNYTGAELDYAPMKKRWFVISGTREGTMFYERVSFTCGGKLINSWAMLYPVAERNFYDRVVEAVARTYTPGAGRTGACD